MIKSKLGVLLLLNIKLFYFIKRCISETVGGPSDTLLDKGQPRSQKKQDLNKINWVQLFYTVCNISMIQQYFMQAKKETPLLSGFGSWSDWCWLQHSSRELWDLRYQPVW